jgi:Spy/CpxP family protein refolding chaperone
MKRFTSSVVMTAVLGLAAYTWSGAQPPGEPRPGRSGGPGFGRAGMALLRGADLSEQQQTEIKAIRDAAREGQAGPPADAVLRRQLDAEVFAEAPDAQKIAALQEQLIRAQAERIAKEVATEQKIAQVLTAEQRAKIRERLAQPSNSAFRSPARPGAGRVGRRG